MQRLISLVITACLGIIADFAYKNPFQIWQAVKIALIVSAFLIALAFFFVTTIMRHSKR